MLPSPSSPAVAAAMLDRDSYCGESFADHTSSLPSVLTDPGAGGLSEEDPRGGDLSELEPAMHRDGMGGSGGRLQDQPSTSRVDGKLGRPRRRGAGARQRDSSRRAGKKRRRTHSETDLRKMRPLIVSPFMPLSTQVSVDAAAARQQQESRRRTVTDSNASAAVAGTSRPAPSTTAATTSNAAALYPVAEGGAAAVKIVGQAKYGALPLKKPPPDAATTSTSTSTAVVRIAEESESESESDEDESSSSSSDTDSSSYTRFSDLTKKQWATVGMLAIANLCSTVAFSCIAPFYPGEAQRKGMSTAEIGIVFGVFELIMFVTAPLIGKYMSDLGSKRMFTVGLAVTSVTAVAFGFLNYLPAGSTFFWASLIIRCLEALGDACFVTSSFAISAKCFPGRIATIVGIMETFAGLGYTAGPVIGGVLYEYGGFQLPFLALGSLLVLATICSHLLVEDVDDEPSEDAMGMLSMLKIPVIWLMVFAVVICAISLSFFDPTLADHLASFGLSPTTVGLMFLLCGGIYTLTAPLWGLLLDRWHCCNALMLFGSCATVISMLLVGPSPLISDEKSLFLIGVSLSVLGMAAGALYIPTFQNCLDAVKENGYGESFHTYGCVSGVFQSAFAFGAFIGPTLGGFSVQAIGFAWTTTIIAGVNLVFILLLTSLYLTRQCLSRSGRRRSYGDAKEQEALEALEA